MLPHPTRARAATLAGALLLSAFALAAFSSTQAASSSSLGKGWWNFGKNKNKENNANANNAGNPYAAAGGYGGGYGGGAVARQQQPSYAVEIQSEEHFVHVLQNNATKDTIIIEFYGPNCPYCVQIAPFYERLAQEYNDYASFLKINAQSLPALAEGVEGLPTFLFVCRGESLGILPGADPKMLHQVVVEAVKKCTEMSKGPQVTLNEVCPASEKFEADVNYYGGTLEEAVQRVPDKESCCGVCTIIPQCKGFTFVPENEEHGRCYPKASLSNKVPTDSALGYVSGTISDAQREQVVAAVEEKMKSGGSAAKRDPSRPDPRAKLPTATCQFEENVDYSHHDLPNGSLKRMDKQDCCDYCAAAKDCKGFTYMDEKNGEGGWCFLKSSTIGKRKADSRMGFTSGYVVGAPAEQSQAAAVTA